MAETRLLYNSSLFNRCNVPAQMKRATLIVCI